jgi:predicted ABC-type ATPase
MPTVYIIAGPPGIGKSTNGSEFLLNSAGEILNHDKLTLYYKKRGELDYENLSNLKANRFIQEKFSLNLDFGVELNLGLENHYDLIRYVRKNHPNYLISVLMFFTDDINLCLTRAVLREQSGGHNVEPRIIKEMYANSISLLRNNVHLISQLQLIDVDYLNIKMVYDGYYPQNKLNFIDSDLPAWVLNNFPEIVNNPIKIP